MTRKILLFLFLTSALAYRGNTQDFNKAKLDSFFMALAKNNKNMGSLAMAVNGTTVYQKAIGYSQIDGSLKRPATIKTKYRIGSITKMFTAVMVFQLIEEGRLSLTTTLATYYPRIPNAAKINIGEMLNHRSGLYNFTSDTSYLGYYSKPQTEAAMVAVFEKQRPAFEPDSKSEYSNTNFVLLGYIVEKITGKTYGEALKERITAKIGLTDTYYGGHANPGNEESYSYIFDSAWEQQPETEMSIPGGAGSLVSTPTDLVKFIDALFTGKLISSNSLERMKTIKDNYGMAMFIIPFYEKKSYGHNGGIDGFSSILAYFPGDRLAVAYISNGVLYTTNDVMIAALSIYFNKPFEIPTFNTIALKTEDLDKYLGAYSSTEIPLKIEITKNNTTLFAQATNQSAFPMEFAGNNKFVFKAAGITVQFDPVKGAFTLLQGGKTYLFTKPK